MDYNVLLTECIKALIIAAVPLVLALIARGYQWATAWIEAHTTNQYLLRIEHEAFQVVAAVGQSIAEPVKEALKDGKLDDIERQRIKTIALDALRARLAGLPAQLLSDQRLSDAIEAAVPRAKAVASVPLPAPASR
jgi:hypothetical protein